MELTDVSIRRENTFLARDFKNYSLSVPPREQRIKRARRIVQVVITIVAIARIDAQEHLAAKAQRQANFIRDFYVTKDQCSQPTLNENVHHPHLGFVRLIRARPHAWRAARSSR